MCDCISKIDELARKDGYELDLVVVEDNSGSVSIAPRVVLKKIGATGYKLKNYRFIVGSAHAPTTANGVAPATRNFA